MIISRTPYRVSFFGGGTDYPVYFREHGGAVLATAIDKYIYINVRTLPPYFEHKHRIVYSKIEMVNKLAEIQHPVVREVLHYCEVCDGLEIHYDGDVPARSGLGSSSTFTVGLLHAIHALHGDMVSKRRLAEEAIHIERDVVKDKGGWQDQVLAAHGGFNKVEFGRDGSIHVAPVFVKPERFDEFQDHFMLFFTGTYRQASAISAKQIENTPKKLAELKAMRDMVEAAAAILAGNGDLLDFGGLLHESWTLKRSLTDVITTSQVDEIYAAARKAGAVGGKLLGAGGGGFMLFYAPPELQPRIEHALRGLLRVPFRFENSGSQIVVYQPENMTAYRTARPNGALPSAPVLASGALSRARP